MNDVQKEAAAVAESAKRVSGTLLSTLTSVGSEWAAYGLKVGKMALVTSAETLGKTAQMLDVLATELEKSKAARAAAATPTGAVKTDVAARADGATPPPAPPAASRADAPSN
jgi:hypothetical protein